MAMPSVIFTLVVYTGVIAVVFYVVLFGQGSRIPGVDWLNHFMTGGCCVSFGRCRKKCLGKRGNALLDRLENYICHSAHPLLQIFYLVLVWGGVYVFFESAYPTIVESTRIPDWHQYGIPIAIFLPNFFFAIASSVNPGRIDKSNVERHLKSFPMDNVIFLPKNCETCEIPRPARSKHCSLCKMCVSRFDHHCAWINNCVGEYNVRYFLLFLWSTASLCLYGSYLCLLVALDIVEEKNLFNMFMRTANGPVPVTWDIAFRWMMMMHAPLISLGLFMAVIAVVVYAFFAYHCYLVARNTTTSETFKWGEARRDLHRLRERQKELRLLKRDAPEIKEKGSRRKGGAQKAKELSADDEELLKKELPKKLHNIYNRGLLRNFAEAFFPISRR